MTEPREYEFKEEVEGSGGEWIEWVIRLSVVHLRGHRISEKVGWEVTRFSITNPDGEGCYHLKLRVPILEQMRDVRAWLMQFRDEQMIRTLIGMERRPTSSFRDRDPDSHHLRAMLRIDNELKKLQDIPNMPGGE